MAFTTQTLLDRVRESEVHLVAFSGSGATVEVKTNLKVITGWSITPAGSPGATELLSLDETVSDFGQVNVVAGAVTVKRAATTTSGLVVAVVLFGY